MANIFSRPIEAIVGAFERKDEREFLPAALEVVDTPASPVTRVIAYAIIGFFACAVIWAFVGRLDILATAQGRILPAGDVKTIQPLDPGLVRAIDVQDGQHVRKGDLLVELDPTQPQADQEKVTRDLLQARLDVARLTALKLAFAGGTPIFHPLPDAPADRNAEAEAAMRAQFDQHADRVADLTQQIAQKDAEVGEAKAQIEKIQADLPMLEQKDKINRDLVARGYGTTLQALDAAQGLSDARHDMAVARQKVAETTAARAALVRQREGVSAQYESDAYADLRKAEEQQSELTQDLVKAQSKAAETELRAPTDGFVQQLALHTLHGVVLPGEKLMTIVPDQRDLIVEAKLANKDVGFVRPGQSVKVKVETFSFTRYGVIEGRVIGISRDTEEADSQQRAAPTPANPSQSPDSDTPASLVPNAASPTYVARISLSRTSMKIEGQERQLQPGMSVTAEIRTGSRTIADYLLSPIARKTQESLHER